MVQVTRLPTEAGRMDGLINYRGEMVPVLDACRLFQRPPVAYDIDSMIAIMRHNHQVVAVVAHETLDLQEVPEENVKIYDKSGKEPFHAAVKIDHIVYPILNPERLQQDAREAMKVLTQ